MLDLDMLLKIKLTAGEWERILRHRSDAPSQVERAKELNVSRWKYQKWEQDTSELSERTITALEWCRLQRWRANISQENLASQLGITRIWLNRMENGQISHFELLEFWEFDKNKNENKFRVIENDDDRGTADG